MKWKTFTPAATLELQRSLRYLYKYIEKKGAIDQLKELGLEEGDIIRSQDYDMGRE